MAQKSSRVGVHKNYGRVFVKDFEKILTRFRDLNVKNGEKGSSPHNLANDLFTYILAIENGIRGLFSREDAERGKLDEITRAMYGAHVFWMEKARPIVAPDLAGEKKKSKR